MFRIKFPRITSGPCRMSLKEWTFTMGLIQIIPFVIATATCYSYANTIQSGFDAILALAIFCNVHLLFVILLIYGQVAKSVIVLNIWIGYSAIEAVVYTVLSIAAGSKLLEIYADNSEIFVALLAIFSGPVFGLFIAYCIVTVYSLICVMKENERKMDMLDNIQRTEPRMNIVVQNGTAHGQTESIDLRNTGTDTYIHSYYTTQQTQQV